MNVKVREYDALEEVKLFGTPSLRFNNLSWSSTQLIAYVERHRVRVENLKNDLSRIVPLESAKAVIQAKFVSINCLEYLAVCSTNGLSLFDSTGETEVASFPISSLPANEDSPHDPTQLEHCCGVEGFMDEPLLVLGCSSGIITVLHLDAEKGRLTLEHTLRGHLAGIVSIAVTMSHVVSGDVKGKIIIWDTGTFTQRSTFPRMGQPCSGVCVQGNNVIAAFASGVLRIYDVSRGRLVAEIDAHCRALNAVAISPLHSVFASVGGDGCFNVYELVNRRKTEVKLISSFSSPNELLVGVAFSKDASSRILTSSHDVHRMTLHSPS